MFKSAFAKVAAAMALAIVITPMPLAAQGFDYSDIGIEIEVEPGEAVPGAEGVVRVSVDVPFGYSLTADIFSVKPAAVAGISFGELQRPEPDKVDAVGGHYVGFKTFSLPFSVAGDADPGPRTVALTIEMQACDEETGSCAFPTEVLREVEIVVGGSAETAPPETAGADRPTGGQEPPGVAEGSEEPTPTDAERTADQVEGTEQEPRPTDRPEAKEQATERSLPPQAGSGDALEELFRGAISGGNLWMAFLLAFAAGLLTSLTPCVYPMIPITISYVSGKAQGRKRSGFFISLVLVLGIAVTYSALGVLAAATGSAFGEFGQQPIVQGIVFVVLFAMGLSLLGLFEIALPSGLTQKLSVRKQGYVGALLVGLTIGFVAAPCVAPILVVMLAWIGGTGNLLLGFLLMFVYALGMGVLFVIVGTFSNAILPKSGEWMVWLKKVFALVLFVVAGVLAKSLLNSIYPTLFDLYTGAVLVLSGVVLGAFVRQERDADWWTILGKTAGILLAVAGIIFFATGFLKPVLEDLRVGGAAGEATGIWERDLDAGLAHAEAEGKPLLIDFWAQWCAACVELDEFTFSDPRVAAELRRFVAIKIDGSNVNDPSFTSAKQRFEVLGLPTVIIRNPEGETVHRFNSFLDADTMLSYLKGVR